MYNSRYLYSFDTKRSYEYIGDENFNIAKERFSNTIEVSEHDAYMYLFVYISHNIDYQFANYSGLDIANEVLLMMLNRYSIKGTWWPNKSFTENERMWRVYAKKSALYVIRKYKKSLEHEEYIDNYVDNNDLSTEMKSEMEMKSTMNDYKACIDKLSKSTRYYEQQMGIFAIYKLQGFTDEQVGIILGVGMPRIYEIKRELKRFLKLRFNEDLK